jgi:hypothetical protein
MEGKEERMLGGAIVNYLFLSQFELMRATLLSLGERNPQVARDIYRAIVLQVWKLKGIVWSESVPSSAHLAWMCLQELQAMEEKLLDKGDGSHEEVLASGEILDYQLSSRDNWWSLHCQPIYNGIEFLLFMEFLKSIVLENGDAIASDIMGEAIVESGMQMVLVWDLCILESDESEGFKMGLVHNQFCVLFECLDDGVTLGHLLQLPKFRV